VPASRTTVKSIKRKFFMREHESRFSSGSQHKKRRLNGPDPRPSPGPGAVKS